jgi:hypothetical protein
MLQSSSSIRIVIILFFSSLLVSTLMAQTKVTIPLTQNADSNAIIQEINTLPTLLRLAFRDDYVLFLNYLKQENDGRLTTMEKHYQTFRDRYNMDWEIVSVDPANGYFRAEYDGMSFLTVCYWKLSDGALLIGREETGCGPGCSSDLSFTRFRDDAFTSLDVRTVIPAFDRLHTYVSQQGDWPGAGFIFHLPQHGKNIRYCYEEGDCVDLIFQDGVFKVGDAIKD